MELNIDQLLQGKATRIKNNEYLPTAAYVEPFLERMSEFTNDFRVQVKLPDQITLTKEGEINLDDVTYNRVYVQAVLPEVYTVGNNPHQEVIGMVYGLDVRKPILKLFKGGLNMACTNLCVFNPDAMEVQELSPESAANFKFVTKMMDVVDGTRQLLTELESRQFDTGELNVNKCLGSWVRNTMHCSYDNGYQKVKLAASVPVDAYKLLFEKEDSDYFVGLNNPTNLFTVYNAFTQINTDARKKDIFNDFERNLLVRDILQF